MRYKYVLFDLDGTLTDPYEGITKSFQYALEAFGINAKQSELLRVIGPPLIDSFRDFYGFDDETAAYAVAKYRERFAVIGWKENRLLDGVSDMLSAIKGSGAAVVLATAKPRVFAEKIINEYDIAKYFDIVVGAELDGSINTKTEVIAAALKKLNNPPLSDVIMVGDRRNDVDGAEKCGIECIGVKVGYAEENELEEAGATFIIDTIEELKEFLLGD